MQDSGMKTILDPMPHTPCMCVRPHITCRARVLVLALTSHSACIGGSCMVQPDAAPSIMQWYISAADHMYFLLV